MEQKDQVKEAFSRIKEDITDLKNQVEYINYELSEIKRTIQQTDNINNPTHVSLAPTDQESNPTQFQNPTDKWSLEAVKSQFSNVSSGNEGVPTNRQTNQQTDTSALFTYKNEEKSDKISHINRVSEVLSSLDSLKKDIRSQFKKLTKQEMLIFSTIYQLEEEGFAVDYSTIAIKLNLSESSIRDYVQRIIKKGIPVQKLKENNKKVTLSIIQDLKKIASLQTILALREL